MDFSFIIIATTTKNTNQSLIYFVCLVVQLSFNSIKINKIGWFGLVVAWIEIINNNERNKNKNLVSFVSVFFFLLIIMTLIIFRQKFTVYLNWTQAKIKFFKLSNAHTINYMRHALLIQPNNRNENFIFFISLSCLCLCLSQQQQQKNIPIFIIIRRRHCRRRRLV